MHDAVQDPPIPPLRLAVAEDAPPERGAVDFPRGVGADADGAGGVEGLEQVRGRGAEFVEDLAVAVGSGEDGAAGEEVGVDNGEVVWGGVEEGGDGGFAGGEGAGEAYEDHGGWYWGGGRIVGVMEFEVQEGGCWMW